MADLYVLEPIFKNTPTSNAVAFRVFRVIKLEPGTAAHEHTSGASVSGSWPSSVSVRPGVGVAGGSVPTFDGKARKKPWGFTQKRKGSDEEWEFNDNRKAPYTVIYGIYSGPSCSGRREGLQPNAFSWTRRKERHDVTLLYKTGPTGDPCSEIL